MCVLCQDPYGSSQQKGITIVHRFQSSWHTSALHKSATIPVKVIEQRDAMPLYQFKEAVVIVDYWGEACHTDLKWHQVCLVDSIHNSIPKFHTWDYDTAASEQSTKSPLWLCCSILPAPLHCHLLCVHFCGTCRVTCSHTIARHLPVADIVILQAVVMLIVILFQARFEHILR
jgi:hypothetical protein